MLIIASCSKDKQEISTEQKIVAKVGDRVITADEFRYSYEFGPGALKKGDDPRRIYLEYMIKELLLANEGYRLGLNNSPYVKKRMKTRRNHDLLEAFYIHHIHSRVKIPEDKIQDAIKKSTVNFRMITWPTSTLEEAEAVQSEANKSSLEDYIEKQLAKQEVKLSSKEFYETDWMDYLEIPPEIFNKIKNLEVGKTSDPFPLGNGYAVAQILDINLHGITVSQLKYGARRKNIERRLYNIQSDSVMRAFMDSVLTPMDVRVKGHIVEELSYPLYKWFQDGLPKNRTVFIKVDNPADTAETYIKDINKILDRTLVTYKGDEKSVRNYLEYMDYYRRSLKESKSFDDFKSRLITEIGRMIMDETFIKIAEEDGYADSVDVEQDLKIWEQKWTYDIFRDEVVKGLEVTDLEMHDYFKNRYQELGIADVDTTRFYKYENAVFNAVLYEKHMERIQDKLDELREDYPVTINEDVLAKIDLTESKKSNEITLFLRKKYSGNAVVPYIDMKWFHLN
jgi:hypothetical protein